jgi:hypothetical protein
MDVRSNACTSSTTGARQKCDTFEQVFESGVSGRYGAGHGSEVIRVPITVRQAGRQAGQQQGG